MNKEKLLLTSLAIAQKTGLFALARRRTANMLRILCYHGFSTDDEHILHPGMFVSELTLRSRMSILRDKGYRVISLDEGIDRLSQGTLEPDSVVLTTDDGFYNALTVGAPIFREFGFPNTLYVTSYYVQKQTPIYNFMLPHLFARSDRESVDISKLLPEFTTPIQVRGKNFSISSSKNSRSGPAREGGCAGVAGSRQSWRHASSV